MEFVEAVCEALSVVNKCFVPMGTIQVYILKFQNTLTFDLYTVLVTYFETDKYL